jgi:hypothetical protein
MKIVKKKWGQEEWIVNEGYCMKILTGGTEVPYIIIRRRTRRSIFLKVGLLLRQTASESTQMRAISFELELRPIIGS